MPRTKPALSARLAFRLPDAVAMDWRKRAADSGLSLSDWVRAQVEERQQTGIAPPGRRRVRSSFVSADPGLLRELAAFGNNLNQIARRVNTTESGIDRVELLAELSGIRNDLRSLLPPQEGSDDAH